MTTIDLLGTHQAQLAAIAAGWLSAGAESFGVWSAGGPVRLWPPDRAPKLPALCEPLLSGGAVVGELRLTGAGADARPRLASEARLVSQLLQVEDELEQMTAELLATQDTLVALYELSQVMRHELDVTRLLQMLATEATRLVKAEGATLLIPPTVVESAPGTAEDWQLLEPLTATLQSGRDLVRNDHSDGPAGERHSLCVVPIRIHGTTGAALALVRRCGGFAAPDLKLVRALTAQAGLQIEHALLTQEAIAQVRMTTEMEVARKVQLQLLPQTRPRVPTLEVYADSQPALQVGGDFYDFVEAPGREPMFLLGDVAGKGTSAALIMSMIRSSARSAARFMPGASPATVLSRANNDLYDDLTMLESFVTTFAAQYDAEGRELRYANAGHAPVVYRPAGGSAQLLESDGVPIGVLPLDTCANHSLPFGPGALLLIATDGFNETRSPGGELFGYERLLAFADQFADQPAQVIAQALYHAVEDFSGGKPQEDDRTLIVIKGVA